MVQKGGHWHSTRGRLTQVGGVQRPKHAPKSSSQVIYAKRGPSRAGRMVVSNQALPCWYDQRKAQSIDCPKEVALVQGVAEAEADCAEAPDEAASCGHSHTVEMVSCMSRDESDTECCVWSMGPSFAFDST